MLYRISSPFLHSIYYLVYICIMSKVDYAICISLYMPYVMSDTVLYTFQLIFSVYIKDVCYMYIYIYIDTYHSYIRNITYELP